MKRIALFAVLALGVAALALPGCGGSDEVDHTKSVTGPGGEAPAPDTASGNLETPQPAPADVGGG
jgi:hypothetical protein